MRNARSIFRIARLISAGAEGPVSHRNGAQSASRALVRFSPAFSGQKHNMGGNGEEEEEEGEEDVTKTFHGRSQTPVNLGRCLQCALPRRPTEDKVAAVGWSGSGDTTVHEAVFVDGCHI